MVPIGWLASVLVAAGAGAWAGSTTLTVPEPIDNAPSPVLYRVSTGTVSRVQSFTAQASWRTDRVARNGSDGTVTTVDVNSGSPVKVGDRLYSVNLRPVVAAEGAVPAFRTLAAGVRGLDVQQLQQFLLRTGVRTDAISGHFDAATERDVKLWQHKIGVRADGKVRAGDILFMPVLPVRVVPMEALRVGATIGPGDEVLQLLASEPQFSITLQADQADLVPLTGQVVVHVGAIEWTGSISTSTVSPSGELVLQLSGSGGGSICRDACDQVPVSSTSLWRADIVSVPETKGPVVPSAALNTRPDGTTYVVDETGQPIDVQIVAAADGRAVLTGIEPGKVVQLFGAESTPDKSAAPVST